ncbi:MAG: hypothetical protein WCO78_03035 [Candidatus Roizmanbacteria bacterium]
MIYPTRNTPPSRKTSERGQALLLLLMMMAVIVTITGAAAYRTTIQTQATKESEESKKAYQGAVGYLEQALGGVTITPIPGFNTGINPVGSRAQNRDGTSSTSLTTKIAKDGMYTVYLYEYNPDENSFTTPDVGGVLSSLYYSIAGTECPVFELTFVSTANMLTRLVTDQSETTFPCGLYKFTSAELGNVIVPAVANMTIETTTYNRSITIPPALIPSGAKLLLIRSLFTNATIGFSTTPASQGRRIFSTARTQEGAQRTVSIYQSYPQIPPELFITSF